MARKESTAHRKSDKPKSRRDKQREKLELKTPGSEGRGVIFIKNLPRGLYEQQLHAFFTQFGKITRLRLSRSKKSGRSRGHGWVEFQYAEVAQIAASTMDNYLMGSTIIKCEYKGGDDVHPNLFKGSLKHFNRGQLTTRAVTLARQNKKRSDETHGKLMNKLKVRLEAKMDKLKDLGVDYTLPPVQFPVEVSACASSGRRQKTPESHAVSSPSVTDAGRICVSEDLPASAYIILDSEDDEITFKAPRQPNLDNTNTNTTAGIQQDTTTTRAARGKGKQAATDTKTAGKSVRAARSRGKGKVPQKEQKSIVKVQRSRKRTV